MMYLIGGGTWIYRRGDSNPWLDWWSPTNSKHMLSYVQLPVTHDTNTSSFEVTCNALRWPTWPFIINLTPVGIFVSLLARLEVMGWAPVGIVYSMWGWKGLKYPSRKLGNVYGWWRKAWGPFPQVHRDKYQWCGYQKMALIYGTCYMIALLYMVMASKIFHNFHMPWMS